MRMHATAYVIRRLQITVNGLVLQIAGETFVLAISADRNISKSTSSLLHILAYSV